jgi:hypothetical protein
MEEIIWILIWYYYTVPYRNVTNELQEVSSTLRRDANLLWMASRDKSNRHLQWFHGQLAKSPILFTSHKKTGEVREELAIAIFDSHAIYGTVVSEHYVERVPDVQPSCRSTYCNLAGRMVISLAISMDLTLKVQFRWYYHIFIIWRQFVA